MGKFFTSTTVIFGNTEVYFFLTHNQYFMHFVSNKSPIDRWSSQIIWNRRYNTVMWSYFSVAYGRKINRLKQLLKKQNPYLKIACSLQRLSYSAWEMRKVALNLLRTKRVAFFLLTFPESESRLHLAKTSLAFYKHPGKVSTFSFFNANSSFYSNASSNNLTTLHSFNRIVVSLVFHSRRNVLTLNTMHWSLTSQKQGKHKKLRKLGIHIT